MGDPANKMRIARDLVAMSLGVSALPDDAEVECCLGPDGVLHVHGRVFARGFVPSIEAVVSVKGEE